MSECIVSRISTGAPVAMPRLLHRYFRMHGNSDGDMLRLPVTLDFLGQAAQHMLTVNIQPRAAARCAQPTYSIFWSIDSMPVIPPFCGILTIDRDSDTERSKLTISGTYHPALGITGAAIEALSGRSIAREIAAQVLDGIAAGLATTTLAFA